MVNALAARGRGERDRACGAAERAGGRRCRSVLRVAPGDGSRRCDSVTAVDVGHRCSARRARVDRIRVGRATRGNRGRVEGDNDLRTNARHRECRVQRAAFNEARSRAATTTAADCVRCEADAAGAAPAAEVATATTATGGLCATAAATLDATAVRARIAGATAFGISAARVRRGGRRAGTRCARGGAAAAVAALDVTVSTVVIVSRSVGSSGRPGPRLRSRSPACALPPLPGGQP